MTVTVRLDDGSEQEAPEPVAMMIRALMAEADMLRSMDKGHVEISISGTCVTINKVREVGRTITKR